MSDSEVMTQEAHATLGGKSLRSSRPRYKSWRKRYRKIRIKFDIAFDENKRFFREEQKLESLSKRLREELDGLLDLCLDLNQNPAIPPELRFAVKPPRDHSATDKDNSISAAITPEDASRYLVKWEHMKQRQEVPAIDQWMIRQQIEQRLAAQGVESLESLEARVPHPVSNSTTDLLDDLRGDTHSSYLTSELENGYLTRGDARMDLNLSSARKEAGKDNPDGWTDLTPKEMDRQAEVLNPHSQHNWLRSHGKGSLPENEDAESLASHDVKPARKRGHKNLAKQVGDRAVERAREELSPGAGSGPEDDEPAYPVETPGPSTAHGKRKAKDADGASGHRARTTKTTSKPLNIDDILEDPYGIGPIGPLAPKRKGKDPDGTYRSKSGKGGNKGGKRKRSGEEMGNGSAGNTGSHKKVKLEDRAD